MDYKVKNLQLPSFGGFYESIWYNSDTEYWEFKERGIEEGDGWIVKWADLYESVGKSYCECWEEKLKAMGLNVKLSFDEVVSPKYYNFETDRIFALLEFDRIKEFRRILKGLWTKWEKDLAKIIRENHTSYDGFVSFMDNDYKEWEDRLFRYGNLPDSLYLSYALYYLILLEGGYRERADLDYEFYEKWEWSDNIINYIVPSSTEAKEELKKIEALEEEFGYGCYAEIDSSWKEMSLEEVKKKIEQKKWDDEHQLKIPFGKEEE